MKTVKIKVYDMHIVTVVENMHRNIENTYPGIYTFSTQISELLSTHFEGKTKTNVPFAQDYPYIEF